MEAGAAAYPVTLAVDYPERQSRWKTLLRLFLALPVLIFAAILGGGAFQFYRGGGFYGWGAWSGWNESYSISMGAAGSIILAIWIAIVFRGYIPRWLFNFLVALMRFQVRVYSYFALLTDTYPPFEGDYPIRLEVPYPERIARWKVLFWKFFTAIPHFVILLFLLIGAVFSVIIGWFAILITGRFPKGLHGYVAGVTRWGTRLQAYFLSLTDEYPPFSLSAEAGPAGRDTYVVSSVIGWLLGAGMAALLGAAFFLGRETVRVPVSYNDLTAGRVAANEAAADIWNVNVALTNAMDPADDVFPLLLAGEAKRLVAFRFELDNDSGHTRRVWDSDFNLKDSDGKGHDPLLVIAGGRPTPVKFKDDTSIEATVIFEIEDDANPDELRYSSHFTEGKRVIYEFE